MIVMMFKISSVNIIIITTAIIIIIIIFFDFISYISSYI